VVQPTVWAEGGGTICLGNSVEARAISGIAYHWIPASAATNPSDSVTFLSPTESRYIYVEIQDENGCWGSDSVYVGVLALPNVDAGPDQEFEFPGQATLIADNFGMNFYWLPDPGLSCYDCLRPIASPDVTTYYSIVVSDSQGCMAIDSVKVTPYFPLYVPNTITPNNDGVNDVFKAYGENIRGFYLIVKDRWGMTVFETNDINKVWDGGINGYYVQNDTYVWEVHYESIDRTVKLRGHVNVIR
jgi:gliding motility-associated-like protein